jgi:protoporphyrinogen oxidase
LAVGILGGGLAGLSVAAHLAHDCEVLEKEGGDGHFQTVQERGFIYDARGPHIIFSRNQEMVGCIVSLLGDKCRMGGSTRSQTVTGRRDQEIGGEETEDYTQRMDLVRCAGKSATFVC